MVSQDASTKVAKRTQGRPSRESGINGREKLIEATRLYLQTNRKISLTRSEIALGCGVTPALISYYFKDKESLVDAVTKPLIRFYSARIRALQRDDSCLIDRSRKTIHLLIDMNVDNAFLVDHVLGALTSNKLDAEDRLALDDVHRAIVGLVVDLTEAKLWRSSDPLLTEVALWGMCRAFGESLRMRLADPFAASQRTQLVEAKVDYVCAAFAAASVPQPAAPFADADCLSP